MRRLDRLALPGYAICLWLMVFPLVDVLILALPPSPGEVEWRYSLIEVLSRSLMTPMLGVFGVLIVAALFDHPTIRKILRVGAWVGATVLVGMLGVFLVDSVGLRGGTRPGLVPVFSGPWLAAFAKITLAIVIFVFVALGSTVEPEDLEADDESRKRGVRDRTGSLPLAG